MSGCARISKFCHGQFGHKKQENVRKVVQRRPRRRQRSDHCTSSVSARLNHQSPIFIYNYDAFTGKAPQNNRSYISVSAPHNYKSANLDFQRRKKNIQNCHFTTTTTISSSSSNSTYATILIEEGEKLYESSLAFLEKNDFNSLLDSEEDVASFPSQTRELSNLIERWSDLWNRGGACMNKNQKESAVMSSKSLVHYIAPKARHAELSRYIDKETIHRWMDVIDQLAHASFDVNLQMRSSTHDSIFDRTDYMLLIEMVLDLWAKSPPSIHNGERAGKIMTRIIDEQELQVSITPTYMAYLHTILACIRSTGTRIGSKTGTGSGTDLDGNDSHDDNDQKGARDAYEWLLRMEEEGKKVKEVAPSTEVYSACMHGFATRGMVQEAEELMQRLERLSQDNDTLTPDVVTCSTLFNAYQKSPKGEITVAGKTMDVATRAKHVLDEMMKCYEESGGMIRIRPNQFTFGTVISLVAKSKKIHPAHERAQKADEILQTMLNFHKRERERESLREIEIPEGEQDKYSLEASRVHFISVLSAYAKTASSANGAEALKRMEELLIQMETLCETGTLSSSVKPNYMCFVIYLDALSKSRTIDGPERAEQVLNRIETIMMDQNDSESDGDSDSHGHIQTQGSAEHSQEWNNYGYNLGVYMYVDLALDLHF